MRKRLVVWVLVTVAALLGVAWLMPATHYPLVALLKNEPLEKGRPLGYWTQELAADSASRREQAANTLADMGPRARPAVSALIQCVGNTEAGVRRAAILALGRIGPTATSAVPVLLAVYQDPHEDTDVRSAAVAAFGQIGAGAKQAVPIMIGMMAKDVAVAQAGQVQMAITEMGAAAVPDLVELLSHEDPQVRAHAAVALNWIGPPARNAVPALIQALQDEANSVREGAAFALLRMGPAAKDAVPTLIAALQDENADVRRIAALALKEIDPHAVERLE